MHGDDQLSEAIEALPKDRLRRDVQNNGQRDNDDSIPIALDQENSSNPIRFAISLNIKETSIDLSIAAMLKSLIRIFCGWVSFYWRTFW